MVGIDEWGKIARCLRYFWMAAAVAAALASCRNPSPDPGPKVPPPQAVDRAVAR